MASKSRVSLINSSLFNSSPILSLPGTDLSCVAEAVYIASRRRCSPKLRICRRRSWQRKYAADSLQPAACSCTRAQRDSASAVGTIRRRCCRRRSRGSQRSGCSRRNTVDSCIAVSTYSATAIACSCSDRHINRRGHSTEIAAVPGRSRHRRRGQTHACSAGRAGCRQRSASAVRCVRALGYLTLARRTRPSASSTRKAISS